MINVYKIVVKTLGGRRDNLEGLAVDGRVILKCNLKK
jgi:hypothetical protein